MDAVTADPCPRAARDGAGGSADGDPGAARHQGRWARIRRLEKRAGGTAPRGEGVAAVPPAWGRTFSVRVRSVHARSFPLSAAGGEAAAAGACHVHVSRITLLLPGAAWLLAGFRSTGRGWRPPSA
jgi:hypothetical protein